MSVKKGEKERVTELNKNKNSIEKEEGGGD